LSGWPSRPPGAPLLQGCALLRTSLYCALRADLRSFAIPPGDRVSLSAISPKRVVWEAKRAGRRPGHATTIPETPGVGRPRLAIIAVIGKQANFRIAVPRPYGSRVREHAVRCPEKKGDSPLSRLWGSRTARPHPCETNGRSAQIRSPGSPRPPAHV